MSRVAAGFFAFRVLAFAKETQLVVLSQRFIPPALAWIAAVELSAVFCERVAPARAFTPNWCHLAGRRKIVLLMHA